MKINRGSPIFMPHCSGK